MYCYFCWLHGQSGRPIGSRSSSKALPQNHCPDGISGKIHCLKRKSSINTSKVPIANGGMIAGGLVWFPLSHKFGRCSVALWSIFFVIVCQIWSASMTHEDQYSAFMASRFVTGFFGTVTGVIGPRMLVDMFFLHQRGRVFTIFHFFLDLGTVGGPTISAFVANGRSWTAIYWWTLGLSALGFILELFFLQSTTWDRSEGADNSDIIPPEGWVANRIATFLPGTAVTPKVTAGQCLKASARPFQVMATPAMVLTGFFMLISFGFYVAMNAITPVWLQKPEKIKGYGFTSYQNALCKQSLQATEEA